MKRSFVLPSAIVAAILLFSSCKTSTSPKSTGPTSYQVTATVDGKSWVSILPFSNASQLTFGGDSNTTELKFAFSTTVKDTGTYSIGTDSIIDAYFAVGATYYDAAYGSTHLTTYSTDHLVGTFNFVGKDPNGDSVVITNGQYNVTF